MNAPVLLQLAEQAVCTPSVDASGALDVLVDALLEAELLKPSTGPAATWRTWSEVLDVRFDDPDGWRLDRSADPRAPLRVAALQWAWSVLETDEALRARIRARHEPFEALRAQMAEDEATFAEAIHPAR